MYDLLLRKIRTLITMTIIEKKAIAITDILLLMERDTGNDKQIRPLLSKIGYLKIKCVFNR